MGPGSIKWAQAFRGFFCVPAKALAVGKKFLKIASGVVGVTDEAMLKFFRKFYPSR